MGGSSRVTRTHRKFRFRSTALVTLTVVLGVFFIASFFLWPPVWERDCTDFVLHKTEYVIVVKRNDWIEDSFFKRYECDSGVTCTWTRELAEQPCADAVVYMGYNQPPGRRLHPHQRTVYFNMESPENGLWAGAREAYDMRMTYELTSDVPATYFTVEDPRPAEMSHIVKDRKYIAMVLGNKCQGKRFEWIQALQEHTGGRIASLGKCMHNVDKYTVAPECEEYARLPGGGATNGPEKKCLMAKFKFYLAFENSQHDDYITEKFSTTLITDTVGVYFGAPNARSFEPGPNAMIYVDDFKSPQALAEYLLRVANNSTLYESYRAWRSMPLSEKWRRAYDLRWNNACNLCNELHRRNTRS